jgi:hypothetical protein
MYSRSERKFLQPDKDKANPNLGPGYYARDETMVVNKKSVNYAPFSSLTPRVSHFEQQIAFGPPPGSYDVNLSINSEHAALFGRSRTVRFSKNNSAAPAPGTYAIPSTIQIKKKSTAERKCTAGGLNHKPYVLENSAEEIQSLYIPDTKDEEQVEECDKGLNANGQSVDLEIPSSLANHSKAKHKLTWRRKHLPPSIPTGKYVYGYEENEDGELVPKKPHKQLIVEEPSHLFSFTEKAKYENRGHGFPKSRQGLTFKTTENPAPGQYEPKQSDKSIQNPALVALSPCKRLTDEIINTAIKQSVPGPGKFGLQRLLQFKSIFRCQNFRASKSNSVRRRRGNWIYKFRLA